MHPSRPTSPLAGAPTSLNPVNSTFCGRPVAGDRALIMAIVNRTPDSFYDRGATFTDEAAMAAVHRVVAEGADVIDIGGVKAGPGVLVDAAEEIERVVPFIEWVRAEYPEQCISVDTWRASVAKLACAALGIFASLYGIWLVRLRLKMAEAGAWGLYAMIDRRQRQVGGLALLGLLATTGLGLRH